VANTSQDMVTTLAACAVERYLLGLHEAQDRIFDVEHVHAFPAAAHGSQQRRVDLSLGNRAIAGAWGVRIRWGGNAT